MRPYVNSVLYHPLDKILGSPGLIRVTRVLAAHGGSLSVSDIARRAKLSLPSIRTALRRLLDLDVVTSVGAGSSLICALRVEHPLAPALVELFKVEQEQASDVLRATRRAAEALRPAPAALWLYGSVARGEDNVGSDIDIALVSRSTRASAQAAKLRDSLAEAIPLWADRISVVVFAPQDLRRLARTGGSFWRELQRDSVVILGDSPAGMHRRAARRAQA